MAVGWSPAGLYGVFTLKFGLFFIGEIIAYCGKWMRIDLFLTAVAVIWLPKKSIFSLFKILYNNKS
jgi:hypothetical protein